jgi:hypothetical protein
MDKSLQQILDSIFDSVARESEAASARVPSLPDSWHKFVSHLQSQNAHLDLNFPIREVLALLAL